MKKLIYTFLMLLTLCRLNSQTDLSIWKCGSNDLININLANDTSLIIRYNQYESSLVYKSNTSVASPTPYIIPVVFHVIRDAFNPTPIPSYQQILWQLATLNAAFSNSLASLNGVASFSQASNTQIQFCLAKQMQTSGGPVAWPTASVGLITYTSNNTALTSNIVANNLTSLGTLGTLTNYSVNFPANMYLNIFCVPNITSGLTSYNIYDTPSIGGMGTPPWSTLPYDGIVMRNDIIGNNTYGLFTANMYAPISKGNILAHEVGHYLGLFHTFETITGTNLTTVGGAVGCYGVTVGTANTEGDLIYDTPPSQTNSNIGFGPANTCNENYAPYGLATNENDQLTNFMSYSADYVMNSFTLKQAQRMYGAVDALWSSAFLTAQRFNLVTNSNLTATGVNLTPSCGPAFLTSAFNYSIAGALTTCTSAVVNFNVPILPGYLSATSFTWNFGDGTSSNLPNPIHTYTVPSSVYTVQLFASNGVSAVSSNVVITLPAGSPKIVGQSGNGFPVCRGTEQTILIQFPFGSSGTTVTDGISFYTVANNFIHNATTPAGVYKYPFTFTVTGNSSYSLVPAFCSTISTGVATFSVIDCCNNLVVNGDMESGNTGYYSGYTLTSINVAGGNAAINYPNLTTVPGFTNIIGNTGKSFIVDAVAPFGCNSSGSSKLNIGQVVSGLKPSSNYFISVKVNQGADTINLVCAGPQKQKIKLFNGGLTLLDRNFVPTAKPSTSLVIGGSNNGGVQIFNYTFSTSALVTTSTTFSLELYQIDHNNTSGFGFDMMIDNIYLAEMNPPLLLTPLSVTSCPNQTVQLNVSSSCANIGNYTLVWTPQTALSCSSCPNPIASPSVSTTYSLLAIPPITNPPTPIIVLSTQITVPAITPTHVPVCPGNTVQLSGTNSCIFGGTYTYTWLPATGLSCVNCLNPVASPSISTIYTLVASSSTNPSLPNLTFTTSVPIYTLAPTPTINPVPLLCIGTASSSPFLQTFIATGTPTNGSFSGLNIINGNCSGVGCSFISPIPPAGIYNYTYTVFSPSLGIFCPVSTTFNVQFSPNFTLTTSGQSYCTNIPGSNAVISVSAGTASGVSYTWQPGNLSGANQTVTPATTTIYTVAASNGGCINTSTAQVDVRSDCCSATNYFTTNILTGGAYIGGWAINQNLTITGPVFFGDEFRCAPNVSITIASGGTLTSIRGTHFYACNNMWQGIVVQNGGQVKFRSGDLFEDAIEAFSVDNINNTTTNLNNYNIRLENVAFNRNYISLAVRNYTQNVINSPFSFQSNVVTCRDFSLSPGATGWPSTNGTGTFGIALNAATGANNTLFSPYVLNNYTPTNLKAPYATQPSSVGVYVENCGTTANPTSTNPIFTNILIGEKTFVDNSLFNLFDNLLFGIYAYASNVESQNNTFQNARRVIVCSPRCRVVGGFGIYCTDNYTLAANNYLLASHPSGFSNNGRINKFYDCYIGIGLNNIFTADVQYANFRGSQTTANPPSTALAATGAIGVNILSNRLKNYKISSNTMQNLIRGVSTQITNNYLNIPGQSGYGQYLSRVAIATNTIVPQLPTTVVTGTARIFLGVYASNILYSGSSSFKEAGTDFRINDNILKNVWRGVQLYGFNITNYSAVAANNTITLLQDVSPQQQFGVYCANGYANVINNNIITGFNTTNTLVTGVYNSMNSAPTTTAPALNSIQCNSVTNLFAGFEFASYNVGSFWRNNNLQTNKRGLYLSANGIIGQQGNASNASDNRWNGATWTGTVNYSTFTDASSPSNSKLYVRFGSPYFPINNANTGTLVALTYTTGFGIYPAGGPFVNCNPTGGGGGGCPTCKVALLDSIATNNLTFSVNVTESQEIFKTLAFNDIVNEPTLTIASTTLNSFYNANLLLSNGRYKSIEGNFATGNLSLVNSLLSAFSPTTNIENNYKTYYSLLKSYSANGYLNIIENLQLLLLAYQCPFTDGAVVYNARALFNLVNETVVVYNDNNCAKRGFSFRETATVDSTGKNTINAEEEQLLQQLTVNEAQTKQKFKPINGYNLYPNPAQNEVTINSLLNSDETVTIKISEANGKILLEQQINIINHSGKLQLNLLSGLYIITITNKTNQSEYKKLIISK